MKQNTIVSKPVSSDQEQDTLFVNQLVHFYRRVYRTPVEGNKDEIAPVFLRTSLSSPIISNLKGIHQQQTPNPLLLKNIIKMDLLRDRERCNLLQAIKKTSKNLAKPMRPTNLMKTSQKSLQCPQTKPRPPFNLNTRKTGYMIKIPPPVIKSRPRRGMLVEQQRQQSGPKVQSVSLIPSSMIPPSAPNNTPKGTVPSSNTTFSETDMGQSKSDNSTNPSTAQSSCLYNQGCPDVHSAYQLYNNNHNGQYYNGQNYNGQSVQREPTNHENSQCSMPIQQRYCCGGQMQGYPNYCIGSNQSINQQFHDVSTHPTHFFPNATSNLPLGLINNMNNQLGVVHNSLPYLNTWNELGMNYGPTMSMIKEQHNNKSITENPPGQYFQQPSMCSGQQHFLSEQNLQMPYFTSSQLSNQSNNVYSNNSYQQLGQALIETLKGSGMTNMVVNESPGRHVDDQHLASNHKNHSYEDNKCSNVIGPSTLIEDFNTKFIRDIANSQPAGAFKAESTNDIEDQLDNQLFQRKSEHDDFLKRNHNIWDKEPKNYIDNDKSDKVLSTVYVNANKDISSEMNIQDGSKQTLKGDTDNSLYHSNKPMACAKNRTKSVSSTDYIEFTHAITADVIKQQTFSDYDIKKIFQTHIEANKHKLDQGKMLQQIEYLRHVLNVAKSGSQFEVENTSTETSLKYSDIPRTPQVPPIQNKFLKLRVSQSNRTRCSSNESIVGIAKRNLFNRHRSMDQTQSRGATSDDEHVCRNKGKQKEKKKLKKIPKRKPDSWHLQKHHNSEDLKKLIQNRSDAILEQSATTLKDTATVRRISPVRVVQRPLQMEETKDAKVMGPSEITGILENMEFDPELAQEICNSLLDNDLNNCLNLKDGSVSKFNPDVLKDDKFRNDPNIIVVTKEQLFSHLNIKNPQLMHAETNPNKSNLSRNRGFEDRLSMAEKESVTSPEEMFKAKANNYKNGDHKTKRTEVNVQNLVRKTVNKESEIKKHIVPIRCKQDFTYENVRPESYYKIPISSKPDPKHQIMDKTKGIILSKEELIRRLTAKIAIEDGERNKSCNLDNKCKRNIMQSDGSWFDKKKVHQRNKNGEVSIEAEEYFTRLKHQENPERTSQKTRCHDIANCIAKSSAVKLDDIKSGFTCEKWLSDRQSNLYESSTSGNESEYQAHQPQVRNERMECNTPQLSGTNSDTRYSNRGEESEFSARFIDCSDEDDRLTNHAPPTFNEIKSTRKTTLSTISNKTHKSANSDSPPKKKLCVWSKHENPPGEDSNIFCSYRQEQEYFKKADKDKFTPNDRRAWDECTETQFVHSAYNEYSSPKT